MLCYFISVQAEFQNLPEKRLVLSFNPVIQSLPIVFLFSESSFFEKSLEFVFNYALFLRTTERSVTVFGNKNQKFSYINHVYQFT